MNMYIYNISIYLYSVYLLISIHVFLYVHIYIYIHIDIGVQGSGILQIRRLLLRVMMSSMRVHGLG